MWDDDLRSPLAELIASARAHIEVEIELGNDGLFVPPPAASARVAVADAPVPEAGSEPFSDRHAVPPPSPAASHAPSPALSQSSDAHALNRTPEHKRVTLEQLASAAASCTACALHLKRKRSVFARGSADAELLFVGEGPGQEEDLQGLPFVGRAGQLLDRMISAMGYERDEVYICNVVKCRPPDNRTPLPAEGIACARFLVPQIELVAPKAIVALGKCATEHLGVVPERGPWRGRWSLYRNIPVMPTYHPAFLLRSPEFKRVVWEDLQQVMTRLGRTAKERTRA